MGVINPVTAVGAAMAKSGSVALSFSEGMAKINTTAQLSSEQLAGLKKNLIDIGVDAGADLATVPDAFEKILSQTGDVALSQDILKSALKGSKAGFTDTTVVADALSQSLSLIGKENTNAQEVLDTFFAAKRVGAGEFKDFARYMPGLIASGQALGKGFKETAGLFSYMTGKGQSAERAAVLMENAFSALGKSDITKKLQEVTIDVVQKDGSVEKKKIEVFDKNGSMRRIDEIFAQLHTKLQSFGKDDKAKINFLEKIGLKDKEARQAFMILASDAGKLKNTINEVSNSVGETDKAFKNAQTPMMKLQKLWSKVQEAMIAAGDTLIVFLTPAFDALSYALKPVIDALKWTFELVTDNKDVMGLLAHIVGVLTVLYNAQTIALKLKTLWSKRSVFWDKLQAFWSGIVAVKQGIVTGTTYLWTSATTALNAVMAANPIGAVITAIVALIATITLVILKYDEWGAALSFLTGPFFVLINMIEAFKRHWDSVKNAFKDGGLIKGVIRIGEVILDALLMPVQQLFGLLAKIPGLEIFQGGADWINAQREKLNLLTPKTETGGKAIDIPTLDIMYGMPGLGDAKAILDEALARKKAGIKNKEVLEIINKPKDKTNELNSSLEKTDRKDAKFSNNISGVSTEQGKSTNISIKFDKLVENIVINSTTLKEGVDDMRRQAEEALLSVINSANTYNY